MSWAIPLFFLSLLMTKQKHNSTSVALGTEGERLQHSPSPKMPLLGSCGSSGQRHWPEKPIGKDITRYREGQTTHTLTPPPGPRQPWQRGTADQEFIWRKAYAGNDLWCRLRLFPWGPQNEWVGWALRERENVRTQRDNCERERASERASESKAPETLKSAVAEGVMEFFSL